MFKKRLRLSLKRIKQLLQEAAFDPRAQLTPMSIVVSLGDASYCESKAIELIGEAKLLAKQYHLDEPIEGDGFQGRVDYHHKMTQAISLLTLARSLREE